MIYILIPIYNEAKNIPNLFEQIQHTLSDEDRFFVFSDDGSSDDSKVLLSKFFANIPHVILGDGQNYGPGNAFNVGFKWIIDHSKNNADIVATLEADCTSDITILPQMIGINKLGFDLVLASVYAQGGGFDKTSFIRKLLSSVANLMFRFLFNLKILTLSSFYRVYSISLLRNIQKNNSEIISEKGFICMLEILVKAIAQGAKVIEVPMTLHSGKRIGKSKMKILKTSFAYLRYMLSVKK